MRATDLDAVVQIDAAKKGQPRPRYFEIQDDDARRPLPALCYCPVHAKEMFATGEDA